jgi:hypothetical protein
MKDTMNEELSDYSSFSDYVNTPEADQKAGSCSLDQFPWYHQ